MPLDVDDDRVAFGDLLDAMQPKEHEAKVIQVTARQAQSSGIRASQDEPEAGLLIHIHAPRACAAHQAPEFLPVSLAKRHDSEVVPRGLQGFAPSSDPRFAAYRSMAARRSTLPCNDDTWSRRVIWDRSR